MNDAAVVGRGGAPCPAGSWYGIEFFRCRGGICRPEPPSFSGIVMLRPGGPNSWLCRGSGAPPYAACWS